VTLRRPHPEDGDSPGARGPVVESDGQADRSERRSDGPPSRRLGGGLMALSSAAVLTIYMAGYLRTRPAADKLARDDDHRRPAPTVAALTVVPQLPAIRTVPSPTAPASVSSNASTTGALMVTKSPAADPASKPAATSAGSGSGPAAAVPAAKAPVAATKAGVAAAKPSAPPASAATPAVAQTAQAVAPATTTETSNAAAATPAANEAAPAQLAVPPQPQYQDGTFIGWGSCRHGDIQASVTIESGRITAAAIEKCWTRYSCSWVSHLPGQVISRQSAEVDYVSGATQSGNAFYYAVVDALAKAKQ